MFVLRDSSHQLHASVLLLITAGSQSETRTVTFCCVARALPILPEILHVSTKTGQKMVECEPVINLGSVLMDKCIF